MKPGFWERGAAGGTNRQPGSCDRSPLFFFFFFFFPIVSAGNAGSLEAWGGGRSRRELDAFTRILEGFFSVSTTRSIAVGVGLFGEGPGAGRR